MMPLSFSDWQLAELLRRAMLIENDAARDRYFERVAVALRGRSVDDISVRVAANAAYAAEVPNRAWTEAICAVQAGKWATR
jgi:predicted nucleic acid-binding protein